MLRRRSVKLLILVNLLLALALGARVARTQVIPLGLFDCCQGGGYCCRNCCWFTQDCGDDDDCRIITESSPR